MPRMTSISRITGGPISTQFRADANAQFEGTLTGGNTNIVLQKGAKMEIMQDLDRYHYRNFNVIPHSKYEVELFDKNGRLKWSEDFNNLVTTEGLNKILDATFVTGSELPTWFVGLIDGTGETPSFVAGDTIPSHVGWVEYENYLEDVRQAYVPGSISGGTVDNSVSRAIFTMTEAFIIAGCFLVNDSEKGGESNGILYREGAFAGGNRAVEEGDTLRVTITLSMVD